MVAMQDMKFHAPVQMVDGIALRIQRKPYSITCHFKGTIGSMIVYKWSTTPGETIALGYKDSTCHVYMVIQELENVDCEDIIVVELR